MTTQQQERYQITFAFGSFVYMFVVIGASAGFSIGILLTIAGIFLEGFSYAWAASAAQNLLLMPFMSSLYLAFVAAIGFVPYRWLCRRGWGWPTKGIYTRVDL